MKTRCTVLLVDDHPAFRLGVRAVIAGDAHFEVVGEAGDGLAALEMLRRLRPAIVVMDLNLPKLDGLGAVRQLIKERLAVRVVVLTMHQEESLFQEALDLGVLGYVLKENAVTDILQCLQAVAEGGSYLSPSLSNLLLRQRQTQQALRHQVPGLAALTPMERRVLKLIAENKTSVQIGGELFISPRTVETHRHNICLKLELNGSHPLLQFALEHRAAL